MHFLVVLDMRRVWEISPDDLTVGAALGEGAWGIVYSASWGGTQVAVKKLLQQGGRLDQSAQEQFANEIDVMRSIRHINIVMFMGAGTFFDGSPFLVKN